MNELLDKAFADNAARQRAKQRALIPDRMKHLEIDARGYAIPFGVMRDADGIPHFAVNDEKERERSIRDDLCSICGKKLFRGRWFVGGPKSAFDPRGCYIDMPMHNECAHYALAVCPYLAAPRYGQEIGARKWESANKVNVHINIDPTVEADRPPLFVAVMAVGQTMSDGSGPQSYVWPSRPYRKVEFWQHGRELEGHLGYELASRSCGRTVEELRALAKSRDART